MNIETGIKQDDTAKYKTLAEIKDGNTFPEESLYLTRADETFTVSNDTVVLFSSDAIYVFNKSEEADFNDDYGPFRHAPENHQVTLTQE